MLTLPEALSTCWTNVSMIIHKAPTRQALAAVKAAGHRRFVLSSGCTLAVEAPQANLDALLKEAPR